MEQNNKPKTTEAEQRIPRLSILPGVAVIAVFLAAVFVALFIFLWRADMMVMVLGGIFSSSGKQESGGEAAANIHLPPPETHAVSDEIFLTPDLSHLPEDKEGIASLLRSIPPCERYKQMLSVSYNEGGETTITVFRDGERYRVESEVYLVICDGKTVYLRQNTKGTKPYEHHWDVADSEFSLNHEMGIPFIQDIILSVENSETTPNVDFNDIEKLVLLNEITENDVVKTISMTYETGMILYFSAETTDGKSLYRCLSTSYTIDPMFSPDTFAVPPT